MTDVSVFADDTGRYRLDSRIATGGMGVVWRGTDTVLDRVVAIKILKAEFADDATFRSRFETEARHAAALHHPGVAAVFDSGAGQATDGGGPRPFLVMEFVDGQPLSNLLRPNAPLDPAVARTLIADAADAIGAAHAAGIVHRDVKPANLLVTPDRQIKITDFGIARAADGIALTATGQVMGTPQYLSPEQAEGSTATPASDIYSLGVVLFECLAGYRPFGGDTPITTALAHLRDPIPDLPDFVPADLAAVVRRALAKKPSERFATAADFAAALRNPAGRIAPPGVARRAAGRCRRVHLGDAECRVRGLAADSDLRRRPHRVPVNRPQPRLALDPAGPRRHRGCRGAPRHPAEQLRDDPGPQETRPPSPRPRRTRPRPRRRPRPPPRSPSTPTTTSAGTWTRSLRNSATSASGRPPGESTTRAKRRRTRSRTSVQTANSRRATRSRSPTGAPRRNQPHRPPRSRPHPTPPSRPPRRPRSRPTPTTTPAGRPVIEEHRGPGRGTQGPAKGDQG